MALSADPLPKITVITVCLNAVETLQRTIDSLLNQRYERLEYIVIDGGSTDGTLDIIRRNQHVITQFVSEPDHGIADAFNKGIGKSTGDLIGILNADDWYHDEALTQVAETYLDIPAQTRNQTILHGDLNFVTNGFSTRVRPRMRKDSRNHWSFFFDMPVHHPTCFVPRAVYQESEGFDIDYQVAMDFEFLLRARQLGVRFRYIPSILASFSYGGISTRQTKLAIQEVRRAQRKNKLSYLPCQASFIAKYCVNRIKSLVGHLS